MTITHRTAYPQMSDYPVGSVLLTGQPKTARQIVKFAAMDGHLGRWRYVDDGTEADYDDLHHCWWIDDSSLVPQPKPVSEMWVNAMTLVGQVSREKAAAGIGGDIVDLLLGSRSRQRDNPMDPLMDVTVRVVAS